MSCTQWQEAEVQLPTNAVAQFKKSLRNAQNSQRQQAIEAASDFWEDHAQKTRSTRLYRERLSNWCQSRTPDRRSAWGYHISGQHISGMEGRSLDMLMQLLWNVEAKPRKLKPAEFDEMWPQATNRDTVFKVGYGASISFDGRTVRWSVGRGNKSVDDALENPVAQAFFAALDKVKWTRGSGGERWGSDEYAEAAAREHGQNPVHYDMQWGPRGEQALKHRMKYGY